MRIILLILVGVQFARGADTSFVEDLEFLHDLDGPVDENVREIDQATFEKMHRTPKGGAFGQALRITREQPARILPEPRRIPHVSAKNLRANLQNSFISVCPQEALDNDLCVCKERYTRLKLIENRTEESLAILAVDESMRQIIVTYRPTRTLKNQFSNLDYELVQYPQAPKGVLIHHGFKQYHFSINRRIEEEVHKLLADPFFETFDLQITGYSLGAGVSIASTPSWVRFMRKSNFPNRLLIYSYAGPRVGNEPFAQYLANFNVPITRFTNREDVVSHVPLRSLGYVHVGVEFHERAIGPNKTELVLCSQAYDEDPACGLNPHSILSFGRHYYPFNHFIPLPPYC